METGDAYMEMGVNGKIKMAMRKGMENLQMRWKVETSIKMKMEVWKGMEIFLIEEN